MHVGLYETARDAFRFVFEHGGAFDAKWTAAINLVELHGARGEWDAFDAQVAIIEPTVLPPALSASFHLHAAEAEQRRGNHSRAGALLLIAGEIADRHDLAEIRDQVRRTEIGRPMRIAPAPARTIVPDDLAAVALQVRAITTSR
jgi:hypothetical protein